MRNLLVRSLLGLLVALSTCVPLQAQAPERVISNSVSQRERDVSWTVYGRPRLEVGRTDSTGLAWVVDAARRSDGSVVVGSELRAAGVRVFDSSGHLAQVLGGVGDGPGEFRGIGSIRIGEDDSIYAFDRSQQRLTVFDRAGELVRDVNLSSPANRPIAAVGRFADGQWYERGAARLRRGATSDVMIRDTIQYAVTDDGFDIRRVLAAVPADFSTTLTFQGRAGHRFALFSPRPADSRFGNCLYMTQGDKPQIDVFRSDGRWLLRVNNVESERYVAHADLESIVGPMVAGLPDEQAQALRATLLAAPRPNTLPFYRDLVVDALGYVWLQQYAPPRGYGRLWLVLAPNGELLGRVVMPEPMRVFEIGPQYILALAWTSMDEELIRVYTLHRGGTSASDPPAPCVK